jgi:hypothetical protein
VVQQVAQRGRGLFERLSLSFHEKIWQFPQYLHISNRKTQQCSQNYSVRNVSNNWYVAEVIHRGGSEVELAFVSKLKGDHGDERLGDGTDAEPIVGVEGGAGGDVGVAVGGGPDHALGGGDRDGDARQAEADAGDQSVAGRGGRWGGTDGPADAEGSLQTAGPALMLPQQLRADLLL